MIKKETTKDIAYLTTSATNAAVSTVVTPVSASLAFLAGSLGGGQHFQMLLLLLLLLMLLLLHNLLLLLLNEVLLELHLSALLRHLVSKVSSSDSESGAFHASRRAGRVLQNRPSAGQTTEVRRLHA